MDPRQFEHIVVGGNDIHSIVMSYLVHNCFNETAESLASYVGTNQPMIDHDNIETRKQIIRLVMERKALKAVELTEQVAKDLLENNKDLHFDLLCLHFVELVSVGNCAEALEFAQTRLAPFGKVQKYVEKLQDVMALLAYEDPKRSPMFHLLSSEYRQQVADNLNRTILGQFFLPLASCGLYRLQKFTKLSHRRPEHENHPRYTPMERLIQQVTVARQYLTEENGKDEFPPFSLKDSLKG
ncbi:unnamed protein product [Cochlearia groenlandica]